MPFDFLKRKKAARAGRAAEAAPAAGAGAAGIAFDGMTEDWRLVGRMMIDGRLSDALNKREPIADRRTSAGRRSTAREPMAPAPGPQDGRPVRPDPGPGRRRLAAGA